jgi:AbiV family abortive infection protein
LKKKLNQYRGQLTPSQIAEGINAARRNAVRLAEDARALLDSGRFPTAAALAILSIEESGKISILRAMALARSAEEVEDRWREYRSHTKKNVLGGFLDAVAQGARKLEDFRPLFREDAEHPSLLDQLKQVGFYTDCLRDAHWSEPHLVFQEPLSSQLVFSAEILAKSKEVTPQEIELWVKHLGPVWNQDVTWMQKALENWEEEMQAIGLAEPGANSMRQFIREGLSANRREK